MAKKTNKTKTKTTVRKDPRVLETYEDVVEFNCPVRGKVKQKVKISRYKTISEQNGIKHVINSSDSIDKLEEQDDGLSIYSDGEDLGITGVNEE